MGISNELREVVLFRRAWKALFPTVDTPKFRKGTSRDGVKFFYCQTPSNKLMIVRLTGKNGRTALCTSEEFKTPDKTRVLQIPCGKRVREVETRNVSP